jgi:hypothetical protein
MQLKSKFLRTIKDKKIRNKWWVWVLGVFLLLFLVATLLRLFYLQPWLEKKLASVVKERTGGLYNLALKNSEIGLLSGTLTLVGLHLEPDFTVWQTLKKSNPLTAPPLVGNFRADKFSFTGLSYLNLLLQKPLKLQEISIQNPHILINKMPVKPPPAKPIHQNLTGLFKSLRIGKIYIKNGQFIFKNYQSKVNTLSFTKADISLNNFRLDSLAYNDPERFLYAQEVNLQAAELDILLPLAFYRLKINQARLSSRDKNIHFTQTRLVPLYSAAGLSRKKKTALTQFKLNIPAVDFSNFNFFTLFRHGNLSVGNITLQKPRLSAFKDALNFEDRLVKPLPHQLMQKLKMQLTIDTVKVTDLDIFYQELTPKTGKLAKGSFQDMNLSLTNLTNDKKRMSQKSPAILKGTALIMGKTKLNALIKYNLLSPDGYHTVSGTIGKGDPAILNPILEQDQLVRVKSGTVQKGEFNMVFNETEVKGTMQLHYKNFKVDLLSKPKPVEKKKTKQSLGKKLLSVFANKVVINTDNEPTENGYKTGKINTPRRQNRSVVTFWVDGLSSGIRSSLGLSSKVPDK